MFAIMLDPCFKSLQIVKNNVAVVQQFVLLFNMMQKQWFHC